MRNKQHSNGTTPVVRLMKKSAFHDMSFDTNINVSCEREYTEQFAPRRDPIVFVFHDEFARIAQQLVNKKCHSTNGMHKMRMDPKTYTITDNMRFDTTAPVMQLPLSRQVRANASLHVEKREHLSDVIPTNDHEHKLVDVRPSNPHSYHNATQLGVKRPFDANKTPTLVDTRRSNPHSYLDATQLGKGQLLDAKHTPRLGDALHANPHSYYEFTSNGMHAVSVTHSDANSYAHTNVPVQIDVPQQHMQRTTNNGSVVKRSIIKPVASAVTRKIVRESCNTVASRPARALKTSTSVQVPTYTVHKLRTCKHPESIVSKTYTKLTPQSKMASHDFTHKTWNADAGTSYSDAGGMVRESIKPPTYVATYADLDASSAYTSERVEQHTNMHANSVHYSISTQSHSNASGRAEEMNLAPSGHVFYKIGGTTTQSTTPNLQEMSLVIANSTPSNYVDNARNAASRHMHYTQATYDQDIAQPQMYIDRESRPTFQKSQPGASLVSVPSLPAEYAMPHLDGHPHQRASVDHYGHAVEYQPLQSFDDGHMNTSMSSQNAERHNLPSHHTVRTNKSAFVRNGAVNLHAHPAQTEMMPTINRSVMNTETLHRGIRSSLPVTSQSDVNHVDKTVAASAMTGGWVGDLRPMSESVEHYEVSTDDHLRLRMLTSMIGHTQPNVQHSPQQSDVEKGHVRVEAMSIEPSLNATQSVGSTRINEQLMSQTVDTSSNMYVHARDTLENRRERSTDDSIAPRAMTNVHSKRTDTVLIDTISNAHDTDLDAPVVASHMPPQQHTLHSHNGPIAGNHAMRLIHGTTMHENTSLSSTDRMHSSILLDTTCDPSLPTTIHTSRVHSTVNPTVDNHAHVKSQLDRKVQISGQHGTHGTHGALSNHQVTTQDFQTHQVPISTSSAGHNITGWDASRVSGTSWSNPKLEADHVSVWKNVALDPVRFGALTTDQSTAHDSGQGLPISTAAGHNPSEVRRIVLTAGKSTAHHTGQASVSATTGHNPSEGRRVAWTTDRSISNPEQVRVISVATGHHAANETARFSTPSNANEKRAMYARTVLSRPVSTSTSHSNPCNDTAQIERVSNIGVSMRPAVNQNHKNVVVDDVKIVHGRTIHSNVDAPPTKATFKTEGSNAEPSLESSVRAFKTIQVNTDALVAKSIPQCAVTNVQNPKNVSHSLSIREREFAPPKRDVIRKTPVLPPKRESIQFKSKGVVHKMTGGDDDFSTRNPPYSNP